MTIFTDTTTVRVSVGVLALLLVLFLRSRKGSAVRFEYAAQTLYVHRDHTYRFYIKRMNGYYRCYIIRVPYFPGKEPKRCLRGYETDPKNNAQFITWHGEKLTTLDAAKNLCRGWANANQFFIDCARTPD